LQRWPQNANCRAPLKEIYRNVETDFMQPVEGKGMEGVLSEGDWNGNGMGVEGEG